MNTQSHGKQGYEISTEKQETFNDMGEICVHSVHFLVIPEARTEIMQLRVVITTLLFIKTKIQLLRFRARNIRAYYNMSTPNMSNIHCTGTHMSATVLIQTINQFCSNLYSRKKKYFSELLHVDAGPHNRIEVLTASSNKPDKAQLLPD